MLNKCFKNAFYDFCCFRFVSSDSVYKLQFFYRAMHECKAWSCDCMSSVCLSVCLSVRDKRIVQLTVDNDLVTGVSSFGATTLDTDGHLWIGMLSRFDNYRLEEQCATKPSVTRPFVI